MAHFFVDLKLVPENEEDARLASLLRLVPVSNPEDKRSLIETESIFSPGTSTASFGGKLKHLQQSISAKNGGNPFSSPSSKSSGSSMSGRGKLKSLKIGVKRKIVR